MNKNARVDSRLRLQDAALDLAEFRQQIRSDLRDKVARGELDSETVSLLATRLREVRAEIRESLRSH